MKKKYLKPQDKFITLENTTILCCSESERIYRCKDHTSKNEIKVHHWNEDPYSNKDDCHIYDSDDKVGAMRELFDACLGIEH